MRVIITDCAQKERLVLEAQSEHGFLTREANDQVVRELFKTRLDKSLFEFDSSIKRTKFKPQF